MDRRTHLFVAFIIIAISVTGCIALPPDSVSLKQKTISSVAVSWKAKLPVAGGFSIERKTEGGNFEVIATLPMKFIVEWSYMDTELETGIKYTYRVRSYYKEQLSKYSPEAEITLTENISSGSFIIDHTCAKLALIPSEWISQAKSELHIGYQHTSHGSQITDGMTGLASWKGSLYAFSKGGSSGVLDFRDFDLAAYAYSTGTARADDLGDPDWVQNTRNYLNAKPEINVIMWSWCGQVSGASESTINDYLNSMNQLEQEFPGVKFVYMTGHVDGTGLNGNLNIRNEQIRTYCRDNDKILYDFADIESYDPDGVGYLNKLVLDTCYYDANNNGNPWDDTANWAIDWQNSHIKGIDWYDCESAHSQPLNANLKAYAAWWLFARLAGWDGE